MIIERISMFTGKKHALDLPVTQEQLDRWQAGAMIQEVFPELTADQREYILTGVTAEEWDAVMRPE